ncbi:dTDP-glucose 4,6-dehydratase [Desulfurococcus mucosus]|uniref:dTDP-glucose 4,6-dehydratase n=1 Tax=Desulfurococcus mucosus (strain ATCC 35584 / DSM 2162 / JCM 9187 / O7/1) TaxID=765177 RepID=E8RAK9_DESM0|nr:dTDP-glucose 4,6-dehydratase [Desulfurococcus mucosus]ADV65445.1 dTDP-glucose 4,6-dehydratase [Desulfurococcus mucosus DSM 2162]
MRIAVLGGAGFIGSNFVRYLASHRSMDLMVYDKLTYAGRYENIADLVEKGRVLFVRGDIANEELLSHALAEFKPDFIVNFAAETHVDRSINDPSPFIKTNVLGVYTVLEVLKKTDSIYIHISTDEVYGDLWGDGEASEDWPLNPSSPYSASKAAGDLLIKSYGRTYGIRYRILRPCNNYGPYQHPEKLIPRTIIRLLNGKPAVIYGDGSQVRDWIHVEDTCRAIEMVMQRGGDSEVYNICANQYASIREIVSLLVSHLGRDPLRDIVYGRPRPGEDRRYAMKCDKIKGLGWSPTIGIGEGLKKTIEWYLSNEWWWRPLVDERYVLSDSPWSMGGTT